MSDLAGPVRPPLVADERTMLEAWLDRHRQTLLWKCEGLSDAQLRERSAPPSTLSLLGLVRHMSEVERGWFAGFAGADDSEIYCTPDDREADFERVDDADPAADLAVLRREIDACRALVAGHDLDDTATLHGTEYGLRWVFVHMIEEYARHNGHADLLRERIDGVTGDFPD